MPEKKNHTNPIEKQRITTSGDIEVSTYLGIAEGVSEETFSEEITVPLTESESIIVVDFGSQYSLLIARRIRECNVYTEIITHDTPWEKVKDLNPKGFILSGGPSSVYAENAPLAPSYVYESHLPVLGICYGMQAISHQLGGKVTPGAKQEFGHAMLHIADTNSPLFDGIDASIPVWMSHGDKVEDLPPGFTTLAYTENTPCAVMGNQEGIFGLQFHPEVVHTPQGINILKNFVYNVCHCEGNWTISNFINDSINNIRNTVGDGKVINALSGGVDSSVVATLIHKAVGDQLTCIFVNNGLLRHQEVENIQNMFKDSLGMNILYIDAVDRFLDRLKSVTDPETKRKIIGEEFIEVFDEESKKIGTVDYLAQGTLYPDVIESAGTGNSASAVIKSHHNVGGLPERMRLKLVEPLRFLFKDEVRKVGLELGMPEDMIWRQPFPGPGLAVRVIGDITREKLEILRAADHIVMDEIKQANLYRSLWQSFAVLTDVKSVGVMGDYRTYGYLVAVRAVTSEDAMTADWARLPYDVLARMSNRIVNEVSGVNRVVYDITSKPPSTIEWE